MEAPNAADQEVRDLADELLENPERAALVQAETAIGVKRLFGLASRVRTGLILLLAGLVVDLVLRILAAADVAKAVTPF